MTPMRTMNSIPGGTEPLRPEASHARRAPLRTAKNCRLITDMKQTEASRSPGNPVSFLAQA